MAHLLDAHRSLTTDQLAAVLWTSPQVCRVRLYTLRRLAFIDRFIPVQTRGPRSPHWVPGPLSARYVALAHGERPPTAKALRERQDSMLASPQLAHSDGTNQFFVDLLTHTRAHPGTRLLRWWPRDCAASGVSGPTRRAEVRRDGHGE